MISMGMIQKHMCVISEYLGMISKYVEMMPIHLG